MKRLFGTIILLACISCETQNPEHYPDSYNQEVDRSMFKKYFPRQHDYSVAVSGNTTVLKATCPVITRQDKYITIDYEFEKEVDPRDIALLNVFMHKKECKNNVCQWKPVSDTYFLPGVYSNKARIKNFFPKGEYRVWYGYYLKKDSIQEFPRFYKTTCYLTID